MFPLISIPLMDRPAIAGAGLTAAVGHKLPSG
jgi:hypothetical protein